MEFLFQTLVGAIVAIVVPLILDNIRKKSEPKNKQIPWINWVIACAVGGGVGGILSAVYSLAGGGELAGGFGNWGLFGASLGVMQWFVLRKYIKISNYWALLTVIGWAVFAFFQGIKANAYLSWFLVGLIVGLLQWLFLRKSVVKSSLWIIANGIAWLIAGTVSFHLGIMMVNSGMDFGVAWTIGWTVVGLIGGVILRFFMVVMPGIIKDEEPRMSNEAQH